MEPATSEDLLKRSIGDQEGNGLALCSILAMLEKISLQLFVIGNQQGEMISMAQGGEQLEMGLGAEIDDLTTEIDNQPKVHPGLGDPMPVTEPKDLGDLGPEDQTHAVQEAGQKRERTEDEEEAFQGQLESDAAADTLPSDVEPEDDDEPDAA